MEIISYETTATTLGYVMPTQAETGLRTIAADILRMQDRPENIRLESNLFELGLESLNVIELLTAVEENFNISIDVEDLSGELFESFGTLVNFVESQLGM